MGQTFFVGDKGREREETARIEEVHNEEKKKEKKQHEEFSNDSTSTTGVSVAVN